MTIGRAIIAHLRDKRINIRSPCLNSKGGLKVQGYSQPKATPWVELSKSDTPCKGRSKDDVFVLLPILGVTALSTGDPGRCPGLRIALGFQPAYTKSAYLNPYILKGSNLMRLS